MCRDRDKLQRESFKVVKDEWVAHLSRAIFTGEPQHKNKFKLVPLLPPPPLSQNAPQVFALHQPDRIEILPTIASSEFIMSVGKTWKQKTLFV